MTDRFVCYSPSELGVLLNEPWEISEQPYRLHAAYALSCLYEAVAPMDDDEDEPFKKEDMFGCRIPKHIFDRLMKEVTESFNDAAENHMRVSIWGRLYSVRNKKMYEKDRIPYIFNFQLDDDEYVITKDGVQNLSCQSEEPEEGYDSKRDELSDNREYLRQVILLAEDDANDGWDKLTDMEILMYCWACYSNKSATESMENFIKEYKDYFYVSQEDMLSCMNQPKMSGNKRWGMYAFSARKVKEWNRKNGQESEASYINKEKADDYWYEVALAGNFKPA